MLGPAVLCAVLTAALQDPGSAACLPDADDLEARADALLAELPAGSRGSRLTAARDRLRAARRLSPTLDRTLRAADLAFAAGDSEEGVDLLAAAADVDPGRLTSAELLMVARRAEQRRLWREAIARYAALARELDARGENSVSIQAHLRTLVLEAEASALAPPTSLPPAEARLALADAKRALSAGRLAEARQKLQAALRISPSYVEALAALGAVETRARRTPAAIRAYRSALAAEPARVETLTALANLLWNEPDRAAKEESLALLDRAVALRPDERALARLSATRWADFGDAARALPLLEAYLEKATPREREETRALHESLVRRVRAAPPAATPAPSELPPAEPASAAVERWQKARVLAERGDPESAAEALGLLSEAERLDPSLAQAPELAAALHQKRGEWKEAEAALDRAARADPSRASIWESLARLRDRDPGRADESQDAWRRAARAGSSEALFRLGEAAESRGRRSEALGWYRRYRDEAPAGLRAADASAAVARLERARRWTLWGFGALAVIAVAAALAVLRRRRSGLTFPEWLAANPARAPEVRPILGRLRHEALKHGGLLLSDGADRIESGDDGARSAAARLLSDRLYGREGSPGLIAESEAGVAALEALARQDGARLNLRHRDPMFSRLLAGVTSLERARPSLERIGTSPTVPERAARRASRRLRDAARSFVLASGAEMERAVDRVGALPVRADALHALLSRVAAELGVAAPELETIGGAGMDGPPARIRMPAGDWETLWRNLFSNVLSRKNEPAGRPVRLGLSAKRRRDPATGELRLRIVLADDLPGALSAAQIRGRPADRGWGVIAELLRKNGGSFDVSPMPGGGFTKGIALELPALEEPS